MTERTYCTYEWTASQAHYIGQANVAKIAFTGAVIGSGGLALAGQAGAATDGEWDQVARCESGGNWAINTGNGYQGGLQFSPEHLVRPRRRRVRPRRAPCHQGRADRRRGARAGHSGPGCLADVRRTGLSGATPRNVVDDALAGLNNLLPPPPPVDPFAPPPPPAPFDAMAAPPPEAPPGGRSPRTAATARRGAAGACTVRRDGRPASRGSRRFLRHLRPLLRHRRRDGRPASRGTRPLRGPSTRSGRRSAGTPPAPDGTVRRDGRRRFPTAPPLPDDTSAGPADRGSRRAIGRPTGTSPTHRPRSTAAGVGTARRCAAAARTAASPGAPPPPAPAPCRTPRGARPRPLAPINDIDVPQPAFDAANQAVSGELPVPAEVPHLPSPDALPPGSTMDPAVNGADSPNVGYLKDLWQAVQNHDISGKEALIMGLSQRSMSTPYPDQMPGPNVPVPGAPPVDPAAAPPVDPALAPPPPPPAPGMPGLAPEPLPRHLCRQHLCRRPEALKQTRPTPRNRRRRTGASTPVAAL